LAAVWAARYSVGQELQMVSRRRHSPQEITSKLHQAGEMLQLGKRQSEIARTLGISVMTYHRWRARAAERAEQAPSIAPEMQNSVLGDQPAQRDSIDNLQLENAWLRRLIVDLLLEKLKLEEELKQRP
jgi:putative transposase